MEDIEEYLDDEFTFTPETAVTPVPLVLSIFCLYIFITNITFYRLSLKMSMLKTVKGYVGI